MGEYVHFELSADELGLLNHVKGAPRAVLNLPVRIDLQSEIDEEKMLEAMRLTVTRLPFCTIRLHENEDGTFSQYYCLDEPQGIDLVDMSDKKDADVDAYLLKMAGSTFENNCNDSQLYNFKLIRTPDGKHTIFFCGYHIIMDSVGVIQVISYFDKVYSALINGTELPEKGIGIEKHIEESWNYINSDKSKRDIEWWCEQFETEPHFASMNPKGSPEYIEGKNYGKAQTFAQLRAISMPRLIPAELVSRINEAAQALNVSPQLYFYLALRTFLAHNSGCEDVCIATTGARRSTLMQKKCGMTLAHMVTWRSFIESETTTFRDALLKLSISQKDIYRHISVHMADYEKVINERFNVPENTLYKTVVFTYQPYFNVENTGLSFKATHVNVGFTPYPLYMNVMPMDNSGDLWADYIYGVGYFLPENIEKFHAFMLKFIEAGLASPEKTVLELKKECLPE